MGIFNKQSPTALLAVIALHVTALVALIHYQPRPGSANTDVLLVGMITQAQPLPAAQPAPPRPVPVKPVQKSVVPLPPDTPSHTAITLPEPVPAPPVDSSTAVASAPANEAPPAPIVLPRFDAAYLQNPAPAYPSLSRRLGEQGKVLLRVVVRPDGTPEKVELRASSGSQRLDEAALDAVRRWRFVPARQGESPITAAVIVPIVFSLNS